MRLENLYKDFFHSSHEDQLSHIVSYRLKRAADLDKPSSEKPVRLKKTTSLSLTKEEKAVMKMLGLKPKDLLALRETSGTSEDKEETEDLFKDSTFDEEDDDE